MEDRLLRLMKRFLDPTQLLSNKELEVLFPFREARSMIFSRYADAYKHALGILNFQVLKSVHDMCPNELVIQMVMDCIIGDRSKTPHYEIWNKEVIAGLANHILKRHRAWGRKTTRVLELGAGNGRLTWHLKQKVKGRHDGTIRFMAADSDEWGIPRNFPVEDFYCEDALDYMHPHIVLSSWMPSGDDWTPLIKYEKSVREYILIGWPTVCGGSTTWESKRGWRRSLMKSICKYQRCRSDSFFPGTHLSLNGRKSISVLFSRKP